MVVNFCLPHFETTASCDKLCADGCDVSNLLSGDPAARRRGFKLEYFLRPPVHVTLHFQMRVRLCRVDVELWPCGSASRRLEIYTSDCTKTSQRGRESESFKLVGRCDLSEEALTCFQHPHFKRSTRFPDPPPEPAPDARQRELWSRGFHSLGSVAQLRVTVPYCAASSILGIRKLAVWGVPADGCTASEVETFQKALTESLKPSLPAFTSHSRVSTSAKPPSPDPDPSEARIPEEFLDPLTQELMVLPMILPSGVVVDSSTLEEYEKREATWGRLPNDPFTGVPFSKDSKPLPNPLLKSRIDGLVLQTGCTGIGNRSSRSEAQASRLVAENDQASSQSSHGGTVEVRTPPRVDTMNLNIRENRDGGLNDSTVQSSSRKQTFIPTSVSRMTGVGGRRSGPSVKRKYPSTAISSNANISDLSTLTKMPKTDRRTDCTPETSSGQASHERRLSQSLDDALSCALRGLPTFTSRSNLKPDTPGGGSRCGSCSCSLDVYSSPVAYALPCGHLLCGGCLRRERPTSSPRLPCPTCEESVSASAIIRVHH